MQFEDLPGDTVHVPSKELRPRPPPTPTVWTDTLRVGDTVDMFVKGGWWPMRVCAWRGSKLEVKSDKYTDEDMQCAPLSRFRPTWRWQHGNFDYVANGQHISVRYRHQHSRWAVARALLTCRTTAN